MMMAPAMIVMMMTMISKECVDFEMEWSWMVWDIRYSRVFGEFLTVCGARVGSFFDWFHGTHMEH